MRNPFPSLGSPFGPAQWVQRRQVPALRRVPRTQPRRAAGPGPRGERLLPGENCSAQVNRKASEKPATQPQAPSSKGNRYSAESSMKEAAVPRAVREGHRGAT